jgi:hypothetical protein
MLQKEEISAVWGFMNYPDYELSGRFTMRRYGRLNDESKIESNLTATLISAKV